MKRNRIFAAVLAAAMTLPGTLMTAPVSAEEAETSSTNDDFLKFSLFYEKGAEDATGSMSKTIYPWNGTPALKNCEFKRPGYVFKGWNVRFEYQMPFDPLVVVYYLANEPGGPVKAVSEKQLTDGYSLTLFKAGQSVPVNDPKADLSVSTLVRNGGDLFATAVWEKASKTMFRLYNPNSGEHFYTSDAGEKDHLVSVGWKYEGTGWKAPEKSSQPVYRLYNPNAGDHHYTMKTEERDTLVSVGWKYEGIGWYSDDDKAVPLYRQYNPNETAGNHNYTTNKAENDMLVAAGWRAEGIGWYGMK